MPEPTKAQLLARVKALETALKRAEAKAAGDIKQLKQKLDQRSSALDQALEQQTATAEIMRVISASPMDVQRVFNAIVEGATTLCGAVDCIAVRFDGELLHLLARRNPRPERSTQWAACTHAVPTVAYRSAARSSTQRLSISRTYGRIRHSIRAWRTLGTGATFTFSLPVSR